MRQNSETPRQQAPESTQCVPDPFFLWRMGFGDETSMHLNEIFYPIIGGSPNSQREIVIISSTVGAVIFVLFIAIVVIMIGICYYVSGAPKKKSDLYVVI